MKKQLIGFILPLLISVLIPLGAIAGLSAVMFSTPWPLNPGDSTTFTVEVQEDGSAAPGKTVTFSVSPDDGTVSLSTTSTTTDSNGGASTTLRTGSGSSGSYTVTASVGTLSLSSSVTVEGSSAPSPPVLSISVISGPGSGEPGDALTFTVEVQEDGSAASGKTVTFSITSGDGNASLGTTSATTGSNGRASTSVTLGDSASGSYTVTATVGSKSTSGTATVNTPPPPPVLSISVISGPGSGEPGDALTFTVEVQEDGSAASGKTVTFSITSGDGNASLGTTSITTGSNGRASTSVTLGDSASGSYTVTATVGSKSTSGTATVNTPPPTVLSISVISGPGSGAPGDALTFTVEVQEDGSAASGKTVTFSITSGDGNASLGTTSITTGSNGRASTSVTLGDSASGSYTVTATVGSKSTSGTATVNTPPPTVLSISVISGPGSGAPGDALTFTVEVQEDGSAASGKTVTFSITSGDGNASLNPTSATTGSSGRASTSVTLGGSASGSYTITATVGSKSTSGTAKVVTSEASPPPPSGLFAVMFSTPWPLNPGDSTTFTVEVQEDGSAAPGKTVTFSVSPDDGTVSLSTTSTTTDSNGGASTTLRTGSGSSGSYTVTASVGTLSLSSSVTVEGSSAPSPPVLSISVISGPGSGEPGDALTFTVEVQEDGSAASGKTVTFSITSGDGNASLGTTSATTGSNGRASTSVTLGDSAFGSYTITATVGSKSTSGTATVVTSTSPPEPEFSISVITGPGGEPVMPGVTLAFVVDVVADEGLPQGQTVTFSVSPDDGTVSLSTTSATTNENGLAQTTLTIGNDASGSYTVIATLNNGISVSGTVTVETSETSPPPPELSISVISGPGSGAPGDALTFIVTVQEDGSAASGKSVTFSITSGDGNASLNPTSATTGSNGRASTSVTLGGSASGSYTIAASVGDSSVSGTATVETSPPRSSQQQQDDKQQETPQEPVTTLPLPEATVLESISGDNQNGMTGEALANSFVVEVRDQYDDPMPGVTVTFGVLTGGGSLSHTSIDTDADGLAQTTLTLGSKPGTNTVEASAEGISQSTVFNVEASLPPPVATSLSIVSGDNQTGLTGAVLANSFVVEVRDQYDDPMPGVTVTFGVLTGGGSLSAATATTDANGRAESTLTLGSGTGTNTVEVSVEGITEAAIFNAVAELLQFDLTVPSGTSLIHVPLKVRTVDGAARTIESIADLYDTLGGADTVKLLITYNRVTHQWNSYLGDESRDGAADRALTDDLGIIASLKMPVTVRIGGDEFGSDGMSTIRLIQGKNLVGLPLNDSRITRVSDLLTLEGFVDNAPAVTVSDNGTLKPVEKAEDDGDISVTGGQAFIIDVLEDAIVTISGEGWDNTSSGTMAAPPLATGDMKAAATTPVLALSGSIVDGVKGINGKILRVIVKNLSTGRAVNTLIGDTRGTSSRTAYELTVVDIEGGRAAAIGDILEISAISPDAFISVEPFRYTVTAEDVKRHRIQLSALIVQEIPTKTQLLPNYPNPFNPETWIPYHLTSDAEVQLTIYDTKGVSVRQLDLGHQVAGYYTNQTKAAYWDGRNENGESVASGVYFYQLQAGGVSATRKMAILK